MSEKEELEQEEVNSNTEDNTQDATTEKNVDPVESLQKQLEEEKGKFVRLYAEFENFRRRSAKEKLDLIGTSTADLMKEILPVIDDFERAIESNKSAEDIVAIKQGFELLHNKLYSTLQSKGLRPIDSKGQEFDPEAHEAVAQIPAPSKKEKGKIIDEVEKGYTLNDKIIRHPKVVVGS